jgi:hypothetical protein
MRTTSATYAHTSGKRSAHVANGSVRVQMRSAYVRDLVACF